MGSWAVRELFFLSESSLSVAFAFPLPLRLRTAQHACLQVNSAPPLPLSFALLFSDGSHAVPLPLPCHLLWMVGRGTALWNLILLPLWCHTHPCDKTSFHACALSLLLLQSEIWIFATYLEEKRNESEGRDLRFISATSACHRSLPRRKGISVTLQWHSRWCWSQSIAIACKTVHPLYLFFFWNFFLVTD